MKKSIPFGRYIFILFVSSLVLTSCDEDDETGAYSDGVFISNEGAFGNDNGSVSFYSYSADEVTNNIFHLANGYKIGDVVQSVSVYGDQAFISVNNSNKVEIADRHSFASVSTVTDVTGPRYFAFNGDKAYVSCWGDNSVKVIDIASAVVTKSISVGTGPEKMAISNGKLYVANAGGWGTDSTVTVINAETNAIIDTISVKYSPRDIEVDKDGNIWVLCFGKVVYDYVTYAIVEETPSMLYKIDAATDKVVAELKLWDTQHPTTLEINNDGETFYAGGGYGFNGIYSISVSGTNALISKIIDDAAYGFSYDRNSDVLFVGIAPDFASAGTLNRYSATGTKLGSYSVGIGPNGAGFKSAKNQ